MKPKEGEISPLPQEDLIKFRENWQREIIGQSDADGREDRNWSPNIKFQETEDQQTVAESFFHKAVELELLGKVYDALPFYKKAVQILPDIEKIFYERQQLRSSMKHNTLQIIDCSSETLERPDECYEKQNLYEKFQLDLSQYTGSLLLSNNDEAVISTECNISNLPPEILFTILRWVVSAQLDMRSLENCAAVSKGMYLCSRDEELWKSACIKVWGVFVGTPSDPGGEKGIQQPYDSWRQMYIDRPRVLYNGCYISKTTYLRMGQNSFQDQYYRPIQLVEYYRYIRFLSDGTMLMTTSADEPVIGVTKLRHLHSLRSDILRGHYRLNGSTVTCLLNKAHNQRTVPIFNRQRCGNLGSIPDELGSTKYRIEFQILSSPKRKFTQLIWLHYSIVQTRNKVENCTDFEITSSKYPPLWFSPVRSYHLTSEAPLI